MKKEENDAEQLLNISLILNSSPLLDPFYLEDDENGDFVHRCWKFNDEYHLNIRSDRFAPEDIEQKPECRHRRNDACKRLLPDIKSRMKKWSDDVVDIGNFLVV